MGDARREHVYSDCDHDHDGQHYAGRRLLRSKWVSVFLSWNVIDVRENLLVKIGVQVSVALLIGLALVAGIRYCDPFSYLFEENKSILKGTVAR
jgi:hypothetical protein